MQANTPTRPKWRFRIFQFSIRTMFLVTAAVAVFCNWYFQPQRKDEELAGGMLKLRRQVKVEIRDAPMSGRGVGPFAPLPGTKAPYYINHGSWSLLDKDDNLLARGNYSNDVPTGWWTIWHVSGKKAAEGRLKNGAKSGVWKTWYEDGSQQSVVTYADSVPAGKSGEATPPGTVRPVRHSKFPLEMSAYPREGVAKAWYPSGQLKFTGSYKDDKEEGPWQLFDGAGKLTAGGPYLRGQRHGEWKLVDAAGKETTVEFTRGHETGELQTLLATLTKGLQSENPGDRLRAAYDLAELGEDGLPALTIALSHSGMETRIAATRSLLRLGEAASPALPKLKELAASKAGSPLKFQAMLAVYVVDPTARGAMFDDLIAQATALADPGETSDAFGHIFAADSQRQQQTLKKMLAWEAENPSRSGQTCAMLLRSQTDMIQLLDAMYEPNLHIASRKVIAATLADFLDARYPRFSTYSAAVASLTEKMKAETDAELKEAGEALKARTESLQPGRGGGFF
ncbi:MAG: HEAT repeat domain-containing protein [Pirellulaceae bacterium]